MPENLTDQANGSQSASGQFPACIDGILPYKSISLFAGASGVGKTALKAEWIARMLSGRSILGRPTHRPTGIYYLAADRPWVDTYSLAFEAAGVSKADLIVDCLLDDPTYDPRELKKPGHSAFNFLRDRLARLKPIPGSLLSIDPMAPLFIQGDQNSARDVAVSLHWIRKLVDEYQCTVVCDMNVTKIKIGEGFADLFDAFSGSAAFRAYADTLFVFQRDDDQDNGPRTLHWQARRAPRGKMTFQFDEPTKLFVPYTGLQADGPTAETDRPTFVLSHLPDDGAERQAWFDLVECHIQYYSLSTFKRDIDKLLDRKLISRDARGHYHRRKLS